MRSVKVRFSKRWQEALDARLKFAGLFFWAADGSGFVVPAPADAVVIVRRTRGKRNGG